MKRTCVLAGVWGALAWAGIVQGAAIEECPTPKGAIKVALPAGLPAALSKETGDIALPGEAFDASDVIVKGHKYRRYLFVWNIGDRWIVATEVGGIALHGAVSVYDLGKKDKARRIEEQMTIRDGVCAAATRMAGK